VKWEKPSLDVQAGTNVVHTARRDSGTVWLDLEERDPQRRYKMFLYDFKGGLSLHFSAVSGNAPKTCPRSREKTVKFRFHLKRGSLYAFWVSPDKSGASHGYVAAGGPGLVGMLAYKTQGYGSQYYFAQRRKGRKRFLTNVFFASFASLRETSESPLSRVRLRDRQRFQAGSLEWNRFP
jgi:hypothetical protein